MLKIYVDAATKGNPGPSGVGIIFINQGLYDQIHLPAPIMSNHEAEFHAVLTALTMAMERELNHENTFLFTDSKIVSQLIEQGSTKNRLFSPYLDQIIHLLNDFPLIIIQWLPEKENRGADQLAKQGLQKALRK